MEKISEFGEYKSKLEGVASQDSVKTARLIAIVGLLISCLILIIKILDYFAK